jgi:hypothetical protein
MLIATSKNAIIIYSSLTTGAIKFEGFSTDHIIAINDADMVNYDVGNDGYASVGIKATKIEGSFSFFAGSPTLTKLDTIQSVVYLSGQPNDGILTVVFPSLGKKFVYVDFVMLSAPKGIEGKDIAQPRTIKWSAQVPNVSALSALEQTAIGLL